MEQRYNFLRDVAKRPLHRLLSRPINRLRLHQPLRRQNHGLYPRVDEWASQLPVTRVKKARLAG